MLVGLSSTLEHCDPEKRQKAKWWDWDLVSSCAVLGYTLNPSGLCRSSSVLCGGCCKTEVFPAFRTLSVQSQHVRVLIK